MAKRRTLRRSFHARVSVEDLKDLKSWAHREGASVGDVVRDMIRRERERRAWADRDTAQRVESDHAAAAERAA